MTTCRTFRACAATLLLILATPIVNAQCEFSQLLAPNAAPGDHMGGSISLCGDVGFLGASRVDTLGQNAGAVYVVEKTSSGWVFTDELHASDATAESHFGIAVCIDGDRALIGADGAAYIFERTPSGWTEIQKLVRPIGLPTDLFGWSVALAGDVVAISAHYDSNGGVSGRGSVFIFEPGAGGWSQTAHLVAVNGEPHDHFGRAVTMFGTTLAVSAPDHNNGTGAVYVFEKGPQGWNSPAKLTLSPPIYAELGRSIALHRDHLIVNSREDGDRGAAYIYRRTTSGWIQEARLAGNGAADQGFAWDVDLLADKAIVAAYLASGTGGQVGQVSVFKRTSAGWRLENRFGTQHSSTSGGFARRVAASGDSLLVSSNFGGIFCNGNFCSSGAAYAFSLSLESSSTACPSSANSTGEAATLQIVGCTDVSRNDVEFLARDLPTGATGVLFYGERAVGPLPFGNGTRCVGGRVYRLPMGQAVGDVFSTLVDLTNPPQPTGRINAGSTWLFQVLYRDPAAGGAGFNLTEALAVEFQN